MVGHCEAGAVKRALGCAALAPVSLAICGVHLLPCQSWHSFGRCVCHALPPHAALGRKRDIGEDTFPGERRHRVRVGFVRCSGRDSEEARFRIDGAQTALRAGLDPGNVVAHRPDLPAFESTRRNQHGQVRLAASAGKRRSDVGFLALRIFDPQDEHVLGHPALIARDIGCDAQREALLTQQRIAAVAGTERPDLARLGKMHDVLFFIAGPGHVLLSAPERHADAVDARHHALLIPVDLFKHRNADARHDAHVYHDVGRVGELHTDLRHGRIQRPHTERQHVHGPAAHAAVEQLLQLPAHLVGIFPIVGRPGCVFG